MNAPVALSGLGLLATLRPVLGELNDLKRVRVAGRSGSLAERGFARSWAALVAGEPAASVAARELAHAVASARLGGIDGDVLTDAGRTPPEIRSVLVSAIQAAGFGVHPGILSPVLNGVDLLPSPEALGVAAPPFIDLLAAQPRAGATRPGHPRLILEPPENHAEHCYVTAVYAALIAPVFGSEMAAPFLASLSHHFHNAFLPDSGFAGEELLGDHLRSIMEKFTARCLDALNSSLRQRVVAARTLLDHADSPEARVFHAADVLDRVLQMEHYAQVAAFETRQALDDLELVHAGPLQAFQNEILSAAGILP